MFLPFYCEALQDSFLLNELSVNPAVIARWGFSSSVAAHLLCSLTSSIRTEANL